MKKIITALTVFLFIILFTTMPLTSAEESFSAPSVTLPTNWELVFETPYPDSLSEHDPLGAGLLEYQNIENQDGVMIYYEKAPSTVYTDVMLKSEAEELFVLGHYGSLYNSSGIMTIAGVHAGYAVVYVADYDVYDIELVFIKGNYYINAYALYNNNSESENDVLSILNSITVEETKNLFDEPMMFIIIGVIIAVIVVIVILIVLKRKRLKIKIGAKRS